MTKGIPKGITLRLRQIAIVLCALIAVLSLLPPAALANAEPKTVRVGYYENEIFQEAGVGEACERVVREFDALLSAYGYVRDGLLYRVEKPNTDTLVFFCHLGLGCLLMSHLMNCSPMVLWQGTALAPTSVSVLYTEERRPGFAAFRAQSIGDVSHLYAAGVEPSFAARFCEVYGNGDRVD